MNIWSIWKICLDKSPFLRYIARLINFKARPMSAPKNLHAYEREWMSIAIAIADKGEFLLACGDVKKAKYYRLRFYGFRKALELQDAANPWLGALMETQVSLTAEGHLMFTRSPLATLLRGMLENTTVQLPQDFDVAASKAKSDDYNRESDNRLMDILGLDHLKR